MIIFVFHFEILKKRLYISFLPLLLIVTFISGKSFLFPNKSQLKINRALHKVSCISDNVINYSLLDDHLWHYYEESFKKGVGVLKSIKHIKENQRKGKLEKIFTTSEYVVDTMTYSYPFLCPKAIELLKIISTDFRTKLENTNLENTRFYVTSAARTIHSVRLLRRRNGNASKYSAHLHGTAFDIGYDEFHSKNIVNSIDLVVLKDLLAETLIKLKMKDKCWVTYELNQKCFHIVMK